MYTKRITIHLIPPSLSLTYPQQPLIMHLACVNLHLSMPEALAASTINAAAALGLSDSYGSLETGKMGDMVVLKTPRYAP